MDGFRRSYLAFPSGKVVQEEPPMPDFVLTTNEGKRIGIEVTEVFHSAEKKQRSAVKNQLTQQVISRLEKLLAYKFTMNVFPDERPIWKAKTNELVGEVVNICVAEFGALANDAWGEITHIDADLSTCPPKELGWIRQQGYRNLPSGIGRIRIHRYDGLTHSYTSQSEGGMVPHLTIDDIEPIVRKKESKLAGQPTLDDNWLLVREGNYYTGTFYEVLIPLPISSSFGRIFLYRTDSGEVIELK